MKKKINVPDSITIHSDSAFEFEKNDYSDIKLNKKKQVDILFIPIIISILFRIVSYFLFYFLNEPLNIILFLSSIFVAWILLVIAKLKKPKQLIIRVIASIYFILILMDVAILLLHYMK